MSLKGFSGFNNSKAAKKVMADSTGKGMLSGNNSSKSGIGLKSNTKAAGNSTIGHGSPGPYGHASLNGAHENKAKRKLSY